MNGQRRSDVYPGARVSIVLKKDQKTGALTYGLVESILTNSPFHRRGIKVRITSGEVGRIVEIFNEKPT